VTVGFILSDVGSIPIAALDESGTCLALCFPSRYTYVAGTADSGRTKFPSRALADPTG